MREASGILCHRSFECGIVEDVGAVWKARILKSDAGNSGLWARRTLAFSCCLAMFLFAVYLGAIGVLLPAIGQTFGLGASGQGRLFPANFAGFTLVVLVAGAASDRLPRKAVLMAGVALFALGLILFARAATFDVALAASALIGGGSGAMGVTSSALALDLYPHRRGNLLAAIQVAFGLGAALGPGVAAVLLHQQVSWRVLYVALALVNIGLLFALQFQKVTGRAKPANARPTPSLLQLLARRPVQLLCLFQILYGGAEVGYYSWMPTYFEKRLPGGALIAGATVTVFWIAMTIGRSLTGKYMGRQPFMRLSTRLALGGAVSAGLTLVWHNPYIVMLFVALTGLCFAGIYILLTAEASERYPDEVGGVFGCMNAIGATGSALIPFAVGSVAATQAGWTGALLLIPCAAAGVAICSVLLQKKLF